MKVLRAATRLAWMAVCVVGAGRNGVAQTLPSEPIAFADGRVTISGDVSGSIGSADLGFFDYSDYNHSTLRLLRVDVSAAMNAGAHFAVLAEVRTENLGTVRPYALYARIRPWLARNIDIQVGRVPPTFGGFARRTYPSDNPLIGYPLAYQYLTSLRADSVPASADELLAKRSLGWLVRHSLGDQTATTGVPLVTAFKWDTGAQVHASGGMVTATASLTAGTLSNPLFTDDNGGGQLAGRVELRPVPGLVAGVSGARGAFVTDRAVQAALNDAHGTSFAQSAVGVDVEYSRHYYLVRFEAIASAWDLPQAVVAPPLQPLTAPLRATSTSIEGRYKLRPGLYLAARVDRLGFSEIRSATETLPWDAPVGRIEIGGGYSIQRNLVLKVSYQRNRRDGGVLRRKANLAAAQLLFWF